MRVTEWASRYKQLYQLLSEGKAQTPEYAEILRPMTEAVWITFTENEQNQIIDLGTRLYRETLDAGELRGG